MNTTNLVSMLSVCRPAGCKAERKFIEHFLKPLGVKHDDAGNIYKKIGDLPVAWSSHTDTVHGRSSLQKVAVLDDWALLADYETANCLGADDTVGVWLMSEMIKARRPGLYIFHRGEEQGGKGSQFIAKNPKLLEGIDCAIALDRKGYGDVITHQGARCCSDAFAQSLAKKLGGKFEPNANGIFTDTANYTDIVGECTNLSVGYFDQHTKRECQDLQFAAELRDKLCDLDFSDLAIERKPGDVDPKDRIWSNSIYDWEGWQATSHPYSKSTGSTSYYNGKSYSNWSNRYGHENEYIEMSLPELVEEYPDAVAEILRAYGFNEKQLIIELRERGEII